MKWWNERRFDIVEVCLVAAFVAIAVSFASEWWNVHPEEAWFRSTYGPARNSLNSEEWIICDFFQDRRDGFFVDVGANHYRDTSNTYYLETELEWSGIAIEPLQQFEAGYREYRPRARFFPLFVSERSDASAKIYLRQSDPLVTSADRQFTQSAGDGVARAARLMGEEIVELDVLTSTLDDILDSEGGMSRALLKLSGSLVHDYATISDDSPSPNRASRARRAATSASIS